MGDFNADILKNCSDSQLIHSLADELSLQFVDHNATNRPPGSVEPKTWIYIIFVDGNDNALYFNNKVASIHTSHNLIDVEIELFMPKPLSETFSFRKFNDITQEAINGFLTGCECVPFRAQNLETELALECLNNNLQLAIDELAPLKTITPKKI